MFACTISIIAKKTKRIRGSDEPQEHPHSFLPAVLIVLDMETSVLCHAEVPAQPISMPFLRKDLD